MALFLLGSMALLFGGYEVVERTWFGEADPELLHSLHLFRGITASVISALVVMATLLLSTPPLIVRNGRESDRSASAGILDRERKRLLFCLRWFVQMRWIATFVATVVILLTILAAEMLPSEALIPLLGVVGGLAVFNTFLWVRVRSGVVGRMSLETQVYVDLAGLHVMLHFSGGIENPMYILALFHVIIGGIVLGKAQCFAVATAASVFLSLLAFGEWSHVLDHYTLGLVPHGHHGDVHASHSAAYVACVVGIFSGTLFLTAYFVTRLSGQLREDEQRMEAWATQSFVERKLLEQALTTTSTAVRVMDADLRERWSNQNWRDWFGVSGDANEGTPSPAREVLTDGEARSAEIEWSTPDQEKTRYFRVVTAPIVQADGSIRDIVDLAQDITHQKEEQARMMRASQLATIGELASHVAHEVNNPIAVMIAKAHLLLSNYGSELPEKVRVDLSKIIDLSERVARISQGLLSYSRPSTGVRSPTDIRVPITEALELVRQRVGDCAVAIRADLDADTPLVEANPQELGQVFMNLFLNAVHAMPDGGDLVITMKRAEGEGRSGQLGVAVEIEDTGVGIPVENRERVFEPFFTTKDEGSGTGLGLSICYGLVDSHGGYIDVKSEIGRGTRFTVWLPPAPVRPSAPVRMGPGVD
jgi:signal transduction histidine kinase